SAVPEEARARCLPPSVKQGIFFPCRQRRQSFARGYFYRQRKMPPLAQRRQFETRESSPQALKPKPSDRCLASFFPVSLNAPITELSEMSGAESRAGPKPFRGGIAD